MLVLLVGAGSLQRLRRTCPLVVDVTNFSHHLLCSGRMHSRMLRQVLLPNFLWTQRSAVGGKVGRFLGTVVELPRSAVKTQWYRIDAEVLIRGTATSYYPKSEVIFDSAEVRNDGLPGPAELLLTSLGACTLKNLERFSHILNFQYSQARIRVEAERQEVPPRFLRFRYYLVIKTNDPRVKIDILTRNLERSGTVYNTLVLAAPIEGSIELERE